MNSISDRMRLLRDHAATVQHKHRHEFGVTDHGVKGSASPRLSNSGLYFFPCRKCGRSIVETTTRDGAPSGTAFEKACS